MLKVIFIAITVAGASSAFAQSDSIRYINGIPVSANDTVQDFPANDRAPENDLQPIPAASLPEEVRETLKKDLYDGWQDSVIYYQKNTGLYLVPVKYDSGVKIFGLNKNGKPVTYDEVAP